MRKLKKSYQKNRVRILLDPWLRRHGFFDTRIVHLHVDHPDLCVYTRNIVTTCACSFVDTWRHVGVAKGFNPFLESHHAGWDSLAMRKVDKTWRVSIRPQALRGELEDCVLRVLRHFPACSNSGLHALIGFLLRSTPVPALSHQRWHLIQKSQGPYNSYTADFSISGDEVVVPDDKSKHCGWILSASTYLYLLAYFCLLAHTWSLLSIDLTQANCMLHQRLWDALGPKLYKRLGLSVDLSIVPYVYGTVKSKCFLDNVKIRDKDRHSCMRKIISYHAWPGKRIWKSAHRAFESIAKHFGLTRDAWSLKDASAQLLDGMRLLVDDGSCCCCRCGCIFPGVAGLVADAGQCYEMIDAKGALSEAFVLLRRFQASSASSTVTVKAARNRVSWFGGRLPSQSGRHRTWDVTQLYRLFSAAMSVNIASVGHRVFEI
jgi:hypothetical protein